MCPRLHAVSRYMQASTESEMGEDSNDDPADNKLQDGNPINILSEKSSGVPFQNERRCHSLFQSRYIAPHFIKTQCDTMTDDSKYQDSHIHKISNNCHSLVLILILISIKTRIGNIFGQELKRYRQHLRIMGFCRLGSLVSPCKLTHRPIAKFMFELQ